MCKRISVIGISAVFEDAKDVCEFWSNILLGRKVKTAYNMLQSDALLLSPEQRFAYKAAKQALLSANMYGEDAIEFDRERTGVILATQPCEADISKKIAEQFNLYGTSYSIDVAGAGSLTAIKYAITELESGNCDVVLTGGLNLMDFGEKGLEEDMVADGMGMLVLKRFEETDESYGFIKVGASLDETCKLAVAEDNYVKLLMALIFSVYHKKTINLEQDSLFKKWIVNHICAVKQAAIPLYNDYLVIEEDQKDYILV